MNLGEIKSNCKGAEVPFTGAGNCQKQEGKVAALLITGYNALYPIDESEFMQGIDGYVTAQGSLRMYPVKNIVGMVLAGGEINAPELGTYGGPVPTNLTAKNVAYQIDGGDNLYKELSKLNRRKMRIMRVDDAGYIYGTVVVKNGVSYFAGFEATMYATRTATDGATAYNLSLFAYYTPHNEAEEKNMNAFEAGLANIPDGLIGIAIKKGSTKEAVSVVTVCGGEDITAEYGDKWKATMFVNTSGANPTTAAFNAETGKLTLDPAGSYRVAPAKALEGGQISGMDGVEQFVAIA